VKKKSQLTQSTNWLWVPIDEGMNSSKYVAGQHHQRKCIIHPLGEGLDINPKSGNWAKFHHWFHLVLTNSLFLNLVSDLVRFRGFAFHHLKLIDVKLSSSYHLQTCCFQSIVCFFTTCLWNSTSYDFQISFS
jgi:hypothetical protein